MASRKRTTRRMKVGGVRITKSKTLSGRTSFLTRGATRSGLRKAKRTNTVTINRLGSSYKPRGYIVTRDNQRHNTSKFFRSKAQAKKYARASLR